MTCLKTCSKCKKDLPIRRFVKSPRYFDGRHPICFFCRRESRILWLSNNPLCSRCKSEPHMPKNAYCFRCDRIKKNRSEIPKFKRRTDRRDLCCKCNERPRLKYHRYCKECKNKSTTDSIKRRGGYFALITPERRRKQTSRHYVNTQLARGKIKRGPCVYCGKPSVEFHHLDYDDQTMNTQDVCHDHHVIVERIKRRVDKSGQLELVI